ncbi:MAG: response regulator transcription factor [Bacteroidetes bacterium]|nr:response regulator transcription factor [Bacteroidota bacterium]
MMTCTIIDDEPKNVRVLRTMLEEYCPEITSISEATNPQEGIQVIRQFKPELVFLDIEMPYGNAFDLLDQLVPVEFEIIFVTAFNNYMLKAFKYSALDYLLKPVNIEELKSSVKRASERIRSRNINHQLDNLLQNFKKQNDSLQKIALPSKEGFVFISMEDIVRFESSSGYTFIHTKNGEKFISAKNIKEYEDILPDSVFFRIHNSHIINLHAVKKYHRGRGGYVEMIDGSMIEVAIRRREEFMKKFSF